MVRAVGLIALISILLAASFSSAGERKPTALLGAGLFEVCTSPDPEIMGFCHGYIQGVHDAWSDELCAPPNVPRANIAAELVDLLRNSEDARELYASALVIAVLKSSFPCE